jgi:hypothetical protein
MYWVLLLLVCFGASCTATCVRDTDCLGTSVCENNGCHLIVKGDAGRFSGGSSQTEDPSSSQPDEPSESASDGGSFSAGPDAGN